MPISSQLGAGKIFLSWPMLSPTVCSGVRREPFGLGIPSDAVKPVLPSPRYLDAEIIEADASGYPVNVPALCLIDCSLPENTIREKYPAFWKYLSSGKKQDLDKGYITSRRTPWYSQERRPPAPFLCTYMGRPANGRKPFRFIWNRSAATATKLYLVLYPRPGLAHALKCHPEMSEAIFRELQAIDTEAFLREGRIYGGGLYKMEPNELGQLRAASILGAPGLTLPRQTTLF